MFIELYYLVEGVGCYLFLNRERGTPARSAKFDLYLATMVSGRGDGVLL